MAVTSLFGVHARTAARGGGGALHLAVSRSARVRLAPVIAALSDLGVPQSVLELSGPPGPARVAPPSTAIVTPHRSSASIEAAVEAAVVRVRPAFALIAGDGVAAVAAAMSADRLGVPIARIGAGLRCDDRGIEAEINRIVLDALAERLYVDGDGAAERLQTEGFDHDRVVRVGSTLPDAVARWHRHGSSVCGDMGLERGTYVLVTLHKAENVRDDLRLARFVEALSAFARRTTVVLCLHPATQTLMEPMGDVERLRSIGVIVTGPVEYPDFLALQASAGAVVTDSAGIQEETTVMGVPCYTIARASERTLTLTHGTNVLLGEDPEEIATVPADAIRERVNPIPLWDGLAGRRVAADLADWSGAS